MKTIHTALIKPFTAVVAAAMAGTACAAEPCLAQSAGKAMERLLTGQMSQLENAVRNALEPDTILGMPEETFYIVLYSLIGLVLVLLIITIVHWCLRNSKKPVHVPENDTGKTTVYAPPAQGPGLTLRGLVEGLPVGASIRYSNLKEAGNRVVVGHKEGCWLTLGDRTISRAHLSVSAKGGYFWVKDCGSKGGTTLNGAPLTDEPAPLHRGDVLVLSRHLTLHVDITEYKTK